MPPLNPLPDAHVDMLKGGWTKEVKMIVLNEPSALCQEVEVLMSPENSVNRTALGFSRFHWFRMYGAMSQEEGRQDRKDGRFNLEQIKDTPTTLAYPPGSAAVNYEW